MRACVILGRLQFSALALLALSLPSLSHAEPGVAASSPTATTTLSPAPITANKPATSTEAQAIIAAVEKKYTSVQSMKASFTQVARSEVFGDETTRGELIVKRPAKMRWSFGSDKVFITNGTKMWIYTAADKQVIEYDDISAGRSTADSLLTSLDKLDEVFEIEVTSTGAAGSTLVLTPVKAAQFKRIELSLTADLTPSKLVMTDTFGQVTELSFSEVQLNAELSDALFEFTPPAGVDVVKAATN